MPKIHERYDGEMEFTFFRPRPDTPEMGDQQNAFYESAHPGVTFLLGGNGCVKNDQPVYDPVLDCERRVDSIDGPFHVFSRDQQGNTVVAKAEQPHPCGVENLYEFRLSNGQSFRGTLAHRVLTNQGWREIGEILRESNPSLFRYRDVVHKSQDFSSSEKFPFDQYQAKRKSDSSTGNHRKTIFERAEHDHCSVACFGESRLGDMSKKSAPVSLVENREKSRVRDELKRRRDFLDDCHREFRSHDEPPLLAAAAFRSSLMPPVDVRERNHLHSPLDCLVHEPAHSRRYRSASLLARIHSADLELHGHVEPCVSSEFCSQSCRPVDTQFPFYRSSILAKHLTRAFQTIPSRTFLRRTAQSWFRLAKAFYLDACRLLARRPTGSDSRRTSGRLSPLLCAGEILDRHEKSSTVAIPRCKVVRQFHQYASQTCTTQSFDRQAKCVASCERHNPPSSLPHQQCFASDSIHGQAEKSSTVAIREFPVDPQSDHRLIHLDTTKSSHPSATFLLSPSIRSYSEAKKTEPVHVTSIKFLSRETYWDFHVPIYENYWMAGVWHHNSGTTTTGLAKAIKFMWDNPAPRKDTPFWIIAKNYEQVCNVCWKEKLHQKGHLPPDAIDWERISWYRPNQDWPFKVPLKPEPGRPGKNWQISFKSYEQGRGAMMGESIGGFLFVEQFPWGLLEEVLRGCREYAFTGNKLAEFTPVDPSLSIELRDMEENGRLPPGWAIYRANTRCAMLKGHVTKQWYDMFFGMLPDATRKVREEGKWGAFEGAVYPEWNPLIHCLPKDWTIPPGLYHRRAVDFGYTQDHAFCCLWLCFDGQGRHYVYDEYFSTDTTMGVIDHWKAIEDKHPWPLHSPYYGTTYVDHDMDAIRTLMKINEWTNGEYDPPQMNLAKKSVHEGIEVVHMLLKPTLNIDPEVGPQPRLKIVKENCPNLCREFINYRYPAKLTTGVNVQAPRQEPIKDDDHAIDALRYLVFSEMLMKNITPSTMAKQHSETSVQVDSSKFNKKPSRRYARRANKTS